MFAVIFEVQPKPECRDDYLNIAKLLKPQLERIDGFIDVERYGSARTQGRMLSLSVWRDEKAIIRWRTLAVHHGAQEKGRREVFEDYRLRVGEVTADSETPGDRLVQQRFDETEVGDTKAVTVCELTPPGETPAGTDLVRDLGAPAIGHSGVVDHEVFASIYTPGKLLLLTGWSDAAAAGAWRPQEPAGDTLRYRRVRVIRDYGMFDRREAPQFYPNVRSGRRSERAA